MIKRFIASHLQHVVLPYGLEDVLKTLQDNGLVAEFSIDYGKDEVEVIIPRDVQIREVMTGFQEIIESGRRRGNEH